MSKEWPHGISPFFRVFFKNEAGVNALPPSPCAGGRRPLSRSEVSMVKQKTEKTNEKLSVTDIGLRMWRMEARAQGPIPARSGEKEGDDRKAA